MRLPFDGDFQQTQNWNDSRFRASYAKFKILGHNGEDYGCPSWTPIVAPHAGVVTEATFDSGYGNYVKVESDTEGSVLAHLAKILVEVNQEVSEGQLIGYSGNTGNSTGPHLHWGYYRLPRNRDNGFLGYIDQSDWLNHQCPTFTDPYDDDHKRAYEVLESYRKERLDGPEGSFEGYVRTIVGRDAKYSELAGQLSICQNTLSQNQKKVTEVHTEMHTALEGLDEFETKFSNLFDQFKGWIANLKSKLKI